MRQRSLLSSPFKWGSALVIRGRLPRSILRGCHGPRLRLLTPPSRYDRDTSPFEWGGERPTTTMTTEKKLLWRRGWIRGLSAENPDPPTRWESTKGWTVVDGSLEHLQRLLALGRREGLVELAENLRRQLDLDRAEILLHALARHRLRDGDDAGLGQHPGQRQLRRRAADLARELL